MVGRSGGWERRQRQMTCLSGNFFLIVPDSNFTFFIFFLEFLASFFSILSFLVGDACAHFSRPAVGNWNFIASFSVLLVNESFSRVFFLSHDLPRLKLLYYFYLYLLLLIYLIIYYLLFIIYIILFLLLYYIYLYLLPGRTPYVVMLQNLCII